MSLESTLLGLLKRKPRTGYDLSKIVAKTTSFYWNATSTQVYQSLKRMAEKGWVHVETIVQTGKPSRQVYHLNDSGQEAFMKWLQAAPETPTQKEPFLVQMYFLNMLCKTEIIEKLEAYREEHQARWEEFMTYRATINDPAKSEQENLARRLPLEAGIMQEEFWLRWCELALKEVSELPDE